MPTSPSKLFITGLESPSGSAVLKLSHPDVDSTTRRDHDRHEPHGTGEGRHSSLISCKDIPYAHISDKDLTVKGNNAIVYCYSIFHDFLFLTITSVHLGMQSLEVRKMLLLLH